MMRVLVSQTPSACDLGLIPGKNLSTGSNHFRKHFGSITSLEEDILNLSSGIYATDLAAKRDKAERYIRDIQMQVEVVNLHAFQRVKKDLEHALFLLSSDNWSIDFRQKAGTPEKAPRPHTKKDGAVLLFSGGLDSFCAASKMLEEEGPLFLVSHITHNRTIEESQKHLHQHLEKFYSKKIDRIAFRVYGRTLGEHFFPKDPNRENSQRTRSLLFLSLAAVTARRLAFGKILVIAENGQFAIHLPLTAARVGPFSTHTAHPEFVQKMQGILRTVLSYNGLKILNPYLYKTKAEVLDDLNPKLIPSIPYSITCWRGSRLRSMNHCGECVPCLTRRIALETKGIGRNEYERDILSEDIRNLPPEDDGKRTLVDLIEFITHFSNYSVATEDFLLERYPELINKHLDQQKAISMYVRFAAEARRVFQRYPGVKAIMK